MDFVNKGFGNIFKIFLIIIIGFIFIKSIPIIIFLGVGSWVGLKGMKYYKKISSKKDKWKERVDYKDNTNEMNDDFDFSNKNIIDVEYEDVKK